ncbi:MAG TPA: polysaccharide deacetylase family protein [Chloroflexia bacterium]|nr:polysaccharide deacetylase family protein [Chloroflexia bacterium]
MRSLYPSVVSRLISPLLVAIAALIFAACDTAPTVTPVPPTPTSPPPTATKAPTETPTLAPSATPTTAATSTPTAIPAAEREFVPVLCYHHIRDWEASDTEDDRAYIVPPATLEEELKWLHDNGYTSVSAEQVYDYEINGLPLPPKPIMLSFDDNDDNQWTYARPLLDKYGFKGVFFIMTVTIDKENYMTADQLKQLDAEGHDIEPHTWDHHMVTDYTTDDDWQQQIVEPKKTLEDLLGHPTPFFAYPFGVYDAEATQKLEAFGYKGAFRLAEVMDDSVKPQYALERRIANSYWTMDQFETVVTGGWE